MKHWGAHPKTTDRVRVLFARASWPMLVVEFLLAVALVSLLLATGYVLTDEGGTTPTFFEWWKQLALALLSFPPDRALAPGGVDRSGLQLITAVAGIVLPALFLGAIVLKLFSSPDLFVMREKLAVLPIESPDPRAGGSTHRIAVRCYSATRFELLDVEFKAVLRCERQEQNGTPTKVHQPLRVINPNYVIARPHVPFTLSIPIGAEDWSDSPGEKLATLQTHPIDEKTELVIMIKGSIPKLSGSFTEAHHCLLAESLSWKPFGGVTTDDDKPAHKWTGWGEFDET